MKHADAFAAVLMLVLAATILICLWRARRGHIPFVRRIAGIDAIEEAVGRATEMGRPIVFGMGWTDIRAIQTHACLSILRHVAHLAATMKTPLIVLVRVANVYPVAEQVVREAYMAAGAPDQFNAEEQVKFLSENGVVYSMGVARTPTCPQLRHIVNFRFAVSADEAGALSRPPLTATAAAPRPAPRNARRLMSAMVCSFARNVTGLRADRQPSNRPHVSPETP